MSPDIGLANWFYQRAQRTPERKALNIQEGWDDQKKNCLETVRSLVEQIP